MRISLSDRMFMHILVMQAGNLLHSDAVEGIYYSSYQQLVVIADTNLRLSRMFIHHQ